MRETVYMYESTDKKRKVQMKSLSKKTPYAMAPGKWSSKSHGKQMKKKDDFAINWVYDDHIKNSTK